MSTLADWIRVELSERDVGEAAETARQRQAYAIDQGFRAKSYGSVETHYLGCLGEAAAARYLGIWPPTDWLDQRSMYRGDVGPYEVRCRKHGYLGLNPGDHGHYLVVIGGEAPVMWLAGEITSDEAFPVSSLRQSNGSAWHRVELSHLRPLPARNGYARRVSDGWLVDPKASFWCSVCDFDHPIIEHRRCREAS